MQSARLAIENLQFIFAQIVVSSEDESVSNDHGMWDTGAWIPMIASGVTRGTNWFLPRKKWAG